VLLQPDCIACILKMSISLIRKLPLNEADVKSLYSEILDIPALKGRNWNAMSPEIIEQVMVKISDRIGDPDPFASEKNRLNSTLLDRYPYFENLVANSADPLLTAVKLAIAGNAIDFMVPQGTLNIEKTIQKQIEKPLPEKSFAAFKAKLEASRSIVYFGDNCGEAVLDRLLIETISRRYNLTITFVTRAMPTLNDVTLKEAASAAMDQVAEVMENGIDGPLPGTVFKRCSAKVRGLVDGADLIISKGGGNYDSLGEEKKYLYKIVFMFLSKCYPYNRDFDVEMFQPILKVPSTWV